MLRSARFVQAAFAADALAGAVTADNNKVFIDYARVTTGSSYVASRVMLEFGARSTGEPNAYHPVTCDAAAYV